MGNDMNPFEGLENKRICVVGDMIVDHYREMRPKRLSPEAPVVIFEQISEEKRPGGAGNVAKNLSSLGAQTDLMTAVGKDWQTAWGGKWNEAFGKPASHHFSVKLAIDDSKKTTIKERIVTKRQQIARIDHQTTRPISSAAEDAMLEMFLEMSGDIDALIFSDYAHGVMTPRLVRMIVSSLGDRRVPIVVDSKAPDTIPKYRGCTIVLPNNEEAMAFIPQGKVDGSARAIGDYLLESMGVDAVGLTLGASGIWLASDNTEKSSYICKLFPAAGDADDVVDVAGAGDTVAAAVAACLALGKTYDETMVIANAAAGVVVRKHGTVAVTPAEVTEMLGRSND
jgi:D-beta-D-heptose 7-phosphate kinase/D-beta-D-heptose 1-phosphate adenosyltransferase